MLAISQLCVDGLLEGVGGEKMFYRRAEEEGNEAAEAALG